LVNDKSGEPDEVVGSWSDITDRKAAEEAIAATRAHVEQLLASSPAVIYSFKASGDFRPTYVSQNIKEWLGYEPSDYLDSPTSGEMRCIRTILHGSRANSVSCSVRVATPSNTGS
jgi:PAS domain-containing protein